MKAANTYFGNYCFNPDDVRCPICKNKMQVVEVQMGSVIGPVEQKMICAHCFTEVKVKGRLGAVEYTEYEEVETKELQFNET